MITADAGAPFTALLRNAPTGLTGTLTVRIEDANNVEVVPATTAGIVEIGGGIYVKDDLVAPATEGDFFVIWNALGVDIVADPLQVGPAATLGQNDYIDLDSVKDSLVLQGQTFADDDISAAITSASRVIDNYCARRFWKDAGDVLRQYVPLESNGDRPPVIPIDDLAALTNLTVSGTAWTLDDDYYVTPTNASADGRPWTALQSLSQPFFTAADGRVLVLGKFGWPAVPQPVMEACRILTVRYLRRVREAAFGVIGFGLDGATVRISSTDPDVAMLLSAYKRRRLFA